MPSRATKAFLQAETLRDVSNFRWRIRALDRGYVIDAIYRHPERTCEPEVWRWIEASRPRIPNAYLPLFVSLDSMVRANTLHKVALTIDAEGVYRVSDSSAPDIIEYPSIEEFLKSPYSRGYSIEQLALARLSAHAPIDGEEYQRQQLSLE